MESDPKMIYEPPYKFNLILDSQTNNFGRVVNFNTSSTPCDPVSRIFHSNNYLSSASDDISSRSVSHDELGDSIKGSSILFVSSNL